MEDSMLECKRSELIIHNIVAIKHSVQTITSNSENDKLCFYDHKIDCNFDKHLNIHDSKIFRIIIQIKITPPENQSGYYIESEMHGYFEIKPDIELDDDKISAYHNTALAMIISYLRAHLRTITHECVFGAYTMPSVDFIDIIDKKNNELKKQRQRKESKKKK